MNGKKHDAGKLQWHLLPIQPVQEIIRVLMFGATKYAPDNWQKVPNARDRYYNALLRHITAWYAGEVHDEETGISHLAHAGCCALFLLWFELHPPPPQ